MTKGRKVRLIFVIALGGIMIVLSIFKDHNGDLYSDEYFRNLQLELKGTVSDKKVVSNSSGILFIDVAYSSIPNYDVRDTVSAGWPYHNYKQYYCVIKNEKAEIVEGGLAEINVGDSIIVSCANNSFKVIRNDKIEVERPLRIRQSIVNGVQKFHKL